MHHSLTKVHHPGPQPISSTRAPFVNLSCIGDLYKLLEFSKRLIHMIKIYFFFTLREYYYTTQMKMFRINELNKIK